MTWVPSTSPPSRPCRTKSSIADRKAASVLPDPVGAAMRVWRPALIAGHASACAGVGAAKLAANQLATAGWNSPSRGAGSRGVSERRRERVRTAGVEAKSVSKRLGSPGTQRRASELLYRAPHRYLAPPARSLAESGDFSQGCVSPPNREIRNDQQDRTDARPQ